MPVKIIGCHAGVSVGPDGATHQALEDVAIMRAMPNMTVIVPCDSNEAHKATIAIAKSGKPAYLRLGREKTAVFTTDDTPFEIGKSEIMFGDIADADVGIVACGTLVHNAILAASDLAGEGINAVVLNMVTIKPIDREGIVSLAKSAGAIVTCEEHQVAGGLGGAVSEVLAEEHPVPMEFIGVHDMFGQSGTPAELFVHYKLDVESIKIACRDAVKRK